MAYAGQCDSVMDKGKAFPLQVWTGPWGSRRLRLPEFLDNRHMKVVRLSALRFQFQISCCNRYEQLNPFTKKSESFFCPLLPDLRKIVAFWEVPRLRYFFLLVKVIFWRKWARNLNGMTLTVANLSYPTPTSPLILREVTWDRTRAFAEFKDEIEHELCLKIRGFVSGWGLWDFSLTQSLWSHHGPGICKKWVPGIFPRQPLRRAVNLATYMCRLSENPGSPRGPCGPAQGYLYEYNIWYISESSESRRSFDERLGGSE